jgi:transcriptional regulator with XRE-family HTH domain
LIDRRLQIDRRCAKASIGINRGGSDVVRADAVGLVFEALGKCGVLSKQAAVDMGLDPATLSRIKSGQARLSVDALWKLPDAFWAEFIDLIKAARNLSEDRERELKAARIGELMRLLVEQVA